MIEASSRRWLKNHVVNRSFHLCAVANGFSEPNDWLTHIYNDYYQESSLSCPSSEGQQAISILGNRGAVASCLAFLDEASHESLFTSSSEDCFVRFWRGMRNVVSNVLGRCCASASLRLEQMSWGTAVDFAEDVAIWFLRVFIFLILWCFYTVLHCFLKLVSSSPKKWWLLGCTPWLTGLQRDKEYRGALPADAFGDFLPQSPQIHSCFPRVGLRELHLGYKPWFPVDVATQCARIISQSSPMESARVGSTFASAPRTMSFRMAGPIPWCSKRRCSSTQEGMTMQPVAWWTRKNCHPDICWKCSIWLNIFLVFIVFICIYRIKPSQKQGVKQFEPYPVEGCDGSPSAKQR